MASLQGQEILRCALRVACSALLSSKGGLIAAFDPIRSERIYSLTCTYNFFFCKNRVVRRGSSVSMDLGFGVLRAPRSPAFSTHAL
jgi:hypothetical protein